MPDDDTLQALGRMLDHLYRTERLVPRWRIVQQVEVMDLPSYVAMLFDLLPPGDYTRRRLADQLNSAIVGRGLARRLGTLD